MVIAHAAGVEVLDAYTIRKVLPRLIVAVMGISLSWYIMKWLVIFFNDLGDGIRALIYAPFHSLGAVKLGGGSSFSLGLVGGAAAIALGIVGMLSLAATGALAVLIGFSILIVRKLLIIFLILLAPIAIACYILPNTRKAWNLWSDTFIRLLMMFPIIAAFIAVGRVFAVTSSNGGGSGLGQTVNQLVAFVAYFAPYFLITFAFKLAGGAVATIGGLANDRSRGLFDRLRKNRQAISADRLKRASSQSLWDNQSRIGKQANKLATWAVAPHSNAAYVLRNQGIPGVSKYGRNIESQIGAARLEQSQKWYEQVNKNGANDKFFSAVGGMYDDFTDDTKQKLVDAKLATWQTGRDGQRRIVADRALTSEGDMFRMAGVLEGSESDSEQKAALALRANASYTANMYKDAEMTKADVATGAALGRAVHGFLAPQDSADSENLLTKMYGTEYAHAATVNAQAVATRTNPDNKPGYGTVYDKEQGKWITLHESGRSWDVLATHSAGDYAQAKGNVLKDTREGKVFDEVLTLTGAKGETAKQMLIDDYDRQGLDPKEVQKRMKIATEQRPMVEDTLFSLAGPYSQASGDTKSRAIKMIEESNLGARFQAYRTAATDPTTRGQGGLPGEPPPEPGQPGGPPPPGR
jgi:hypothetical protein